MLFEMATGTGKTLAIAILMKRWFQTALISRVLFLVDRIELASETFDDYLRDFFLIAEGSLDDEIRAREIILVGPEGLAIDRKAYREKWEMIQIQVPEILHKAEGGVFPNFNKDQLSSLLIPVPSFPDQEAFVQEMKALEYLKNEAVA